VVANHGTVSTASSRPGAMETGPTTCTGHRADLVVATPVSEGWAAGMVASITSMGLGAAVCLAVIALVVVALVGGGLVEADSAEGSAGKSTDKLQWESRAKCRVTSGERAVTRSTVFR
jgi:hypothetical protein